MKDHIDRAKDWLKDSLRQGRPAPVRSPKWPAKRREHLLKHPECAACGEKDHAQVHHIKPYHIWPELELVDENLITLCEQKDDGNHHLRIGHRGDWKGFNPQVVEEAKASLVARTVTGPL